MITELMARSRRSSSMECVLILGSEGFNHVAHLNGFFLFFAFNVNAEMLKSRKEKRLQGAEKGVVRGGDGRGGEGGEKPKV